MVTISHAIQKAQLAVSCDSAGDYEDALLLYQSAVAIIETVIKDAPKSSLATLQHYKDTYSARITSLLTHLNSIRTITPLDNVQHDDVEVFHDFIPPSSVDIPPSPSSSQLLRIDSPDPTLFTSFNSYEISFFLASQLASCIRSGGHLSPSLYVPRLLWNQSSQNAIKCLPYSSDQCIFFNSLADLLLILLRSFTRSSNVNDINSSLKQFLIDAHNKRDVLAKKLPTLLPSTSRNVLHRNAAQFLSKVGQIGPLVKQVPVPIYADAVCFCCERFLLLNKPFQRFMNNDDHLMLIMEVIGFVSSSLLKLGLDSVKSLLSVYFADMHQTLLPSL
ncbi:hypothetical protein RCL1_003757 [Eukaryota sp. TZLM3-RCL]